MDKDFDIKIENDISKTLKRKMQDSARDINIQSRDGYITLSGFVDVLSEKKLAEQLTTGVNGVKNVENCITIATDGTITDKEIEIEVMNKLDDMEETVSVGAKVQRGVAVLEGTVDTLQDKNAAINQAMEAFGVKDVVSHIGLDPVKKVDNATIHNEIQRQFVNMGLTNQHMQVHVDNGAVSLSGFVNTRDDMEFAIEIAEGIEGVRNVKNHLKFRADEGGI